MQKALLIKIDGTRTIVTPKDGKEFSLEELQGFVEGHIEHVGFPDGSEMYVNEEGKLIGLPINFYATVIWREQFPGDHDVIIGNAVYFDIPRHSFTEFDEYTRRSICEFCGKAPNEVEGKRCPGLAAVEA